MLNSSLKAGDVQSRSGDATISVRAGGRGAGAASACGFREKNNDIRCLERWSAVQLVIPATCTMVMSMS